MQNDGSAHCEHNGWLWLPTDFIPNPIMSTATRKMEICTLHAAQELQCNVLAGAFWASELRAVDYCSAIVTASDRATLWLCLRYLFSSTWVTWLFALCSQQRSNNDSSCIQHGTSMIHIPAKHPHRSHTQTQGIFKLKQSDKYRKKSGAQSPQTGVLGVLCTFGRNQIISRKINNLWK